MNTLEPAAQSKPPGGFKLWLSQLQMKHGRKLVIALPYIWLILLFLLPFLIVFKISLAEMARAIPPYTELMEWADGQLSITLNLGNFLQLTDDPLYFDAYLQSLQVAAISTFCCLLIGYPLAWAVAHSKPSTRNILLLLVILPSWTSFLIRVYAWMGILKNNGVLNNFLLWLGVIDQPLTILHTNLAVYIGIVYAYVPFMVLPIYTALIRIDYSLVKGRRWARWLYLLTQITAASYLWAASLGYGYPELFSIPGESKREIFHSLMLQKLPDMLILMLLFVPSTSRRFFQLQ
ncbi:DUF2593 family protein [Escherichia coli]|nr:DUF2593 family protein [Escherichia coli]EHD3370911.1 DUF2593 family protein [Escherichia coli O124]EHD3426884.1 DUF2593 family protein [Escherichia coli O124]EHD5657725.1 DUF2593 family protein [Escherichia coli]